MTKTITKDHWTEYNNTDGAELIASYIVGVHLEHCTENH